MRFWITILSLPLLAACRASDTTAKVTDVVEPNLQLTALSDSLEVLRADFNENSGRPRLVTLLSPTGGACQYGSRALREAVLDEFPDADLRVEVIWIDMIPGDCADSAVETALAHLDDPRVRHFHDRERRAGRAFAEDLLPTSVAWDVYLFYPRGAEWTDTPPKPQFWSHQLGRIEVDHFHPREELNERLRQAMRSLFQAEPTASGER